MLAGAQELSALVFLANYARPTMDSVFIPFGPGCSTIWALPYAEIAKSNPRAVIGLTDPSARLTMRRLVGRELLSFAMPLSLFEEMESNVPGSFLERGTWQKLDRN
jgi:hypothetical protein